MTAKIHPFRPTVNPFAQRPSSDTMTTAIGVALAMLLLFAPAEVQSRTKAKPNAPSADKWVREPTSFLSLPLGGALQSQRGHGRDGLVDEVARAHVGTHPALCLGGRAGVDIQFSHHMLGEWYC